MEGKIIFQKKIDQVNRSSSWTNSEALDLPVVKESHFIIFKKSSSHSQIKLSFEFTFVQTANCHEPENDKFLKNYQTGTHLNQNLSIYNIIRWVAWTTGKKNCRPSV